MCDFDLNGERSNGVKGEGAEGGKGVDGRNIEPAYEDVKTWVESKWGWGVGGREWKWVRGGKGWWFPGFVGE